MTQRGEPGWEVGGRFKTEEICVHLWLIRADLWQNPTQHCKAITLQLKINNFLKEQQKREIKQKSSRFPPCSLSPGMIWGSLSPGMVQRSKSSAQRDLLGRGMLSALLNTNLSHMVGSYGHSIRLSRHRLPGWLP